MPCGRLDDVYDLCFWLVRQAKYLSSLFPTPPTTPRLDELPDDEDRVGKIKALLKAQQVRRLGGKGPWRNGGEKGDRKLFWWFLNGSVEMINTEAFDICVACTPAQLLFSHLYPALTKLTLLISTALLPSPEGRPRKRSEEEAQGPQEGAARGGRGGGA